MAKQSFMSRVKAYRKLHPRCTQVEAMKKLKGTTVSGTRRKKSTTAKAKAPRKKSVTKTVRVTSVGSTRKTVTTGAEGLLKKGMAIISTIDRLEVRYKSTKSKAAKKLLATVINAEHDKLDRIQKQAKLKSA